MGWWCLCERSIQEIQRIKNYRVPVVTYSFVQYGSPEMFSPSWKTNVLLGTDAVETTRNKTLTGPVLHYQSKQYLTNIRRSWDPARLLKLETFHSISGMNLWEVFDEVKVECRFLLLHLLLKLVKSAKIPRSLLSRWGSLDKEMNSYICSFIFHHFEFGMTGRRERSVWHTLLWL